MIENWLGAAMAIMRLNMVNSSKPHWLDRKICKNERSKNRGLPIKRCGVKAMFRHSTKKVFYLCNACNKEFHEDGDKFKLTKQGN